jgi:uncharacterized RDD family membrane protein YckC
MTVDQYIHAVLDLMPQATPGRDQIARELRANIHERLERGEQLLDVLAQLGKPAKLADEYLAAIPMVAVPTSERFLAKLIDFGPVLVVVMPLVYVAVKRMAFPEFNWILFCAFTFACSGVGLCIYTALAELATSRTLGKWMRGLHVVQESGRRITIGQSLVRQLPFLMSIYFIDAFFALFTDRHQRAFEMLSKTRVVVASTSEI